MNLVIPLGFQGSLPFGIQVAQKQRPPRRNQATVAQRVRHGQTGEQQFSRRRRVRGRLGDGTARNPCRLYIKVSKIMIY